MSIASYFTIAISALMGLVALVAPVSRRLGLPTPVCFAALGLAYGVAKDWLGVGLSGAALDSYDQWFVGSIAVDGEGLLLLFLPPLLFEMALAVDMRRLAQDWAAVALMAIVAVAAATALVGVGAWLASPLGLVTCVLIGAAVSTTDPAAVITTFRELGAPRRLLTLLEGESLLNDAAAIALFTLFLGVAASGEASPGALAARFATDFGVGAAVGVAAAVAAAYVFRLLERVPAAETSATVALAYAGYLAAEALGGSGVVAVVAAGIWTGTVGFASMGPRSWSAVTTVWGQIGVWANAAILFLVASATPELLRGFDATAAALLAGVYLGALAARALVLWLLLPALDRAGLSTPLEGRQKLLVLWGGVRGAVTLVLALSLTEVAALGEEARMAGAAAAAYSLLTLGLNAATLGWATRRLGLDALSPSDQALRERIAAGALARVGAVVANIARARDLEPAALDAVGAELERQRVAATAEADETGGGGKIPFGERLRLGLAILCGQEARLVRRGFEDSAIGPRAMFALAAVAGRLQDAVRAEGREGYEAAAARALDPSALDRAAFALHRWAGLDGPLRRRMELRQTALLETQRILGELRRFAADRLPPMIGEDAAENLGGLLAWRLDRAEAESDALSLQYPEYALALEKTLIARAAIRRERQEYERLLRDGAIGRELHDDLARELDQREREAAKAPRLDREPSAFDLLARAPIFDGLDEARRRRVARALRPRIVHPGEVVLDYGARGDAMYFVASGALEVRGAAREIRLSNGDFFGELALLAPTRRRRTRVVALGYGRLLALSRRDFRRLADEDRELEARIRAAAERQLGGGFATGRAAG